MEEKENIVMFKYSVSTCLYAGFGLICVLLVSTIIIAILAISSIGRGLREVQSVNKDSRDSLVIKSNIYSINDTVKHIALIDSIDEKKILLGNNKNITADFMPLFDSLVSNNSDPEGRKIVENFRQATITGRDQTQILIDYALHNQSSDFVTYLGKVTENTDKRFNPALNHLVDYYATRADNITREVVNRSQQTIYIMLVCGITMVAASFIIIIMISRTIIQPIRACMTLAKMSVNSSSVVNEALQYKDEIYFLKSALQNLLTGDNHQNK